MIAEGEEAPTFELAGVRDGRIEQIALSEYLGDEIVILAFYPGDFNPACSDGTTDLDDLDLFTMQKDVSVLGLSGDSVYSHRAFAEEYDLHIPLLSDAHGKVAAAYGVAVEDDSVGHLTRRAIVVLGPQGEVEYTWVADDVDGMPDVDAVREVTQDVGGQDTALARYRVGHAHYTEGQRAFTGAMNAYEETEWMMAKGDFDRAHEAFAAAEDEFNTAARFAEEERSRRYSERAERRAESLCRAAEWLGDSANAYASGDGRTAESLRRDAEASLETARQIHEPPSPDGFPPDKDPAELDEGSVALGPEEDISLDLDVEETAEGAPATGADADGGTTATGAESADTGETATGDAPGLDDGVSATDGNVTDAGDEATGADGSRAEGTDGETAPTGAGDDADDGAGEIDEAELEEIAAELAEQTEAAREEDAGEVDDGNLVPSSIDVDAAAEPSPDRESGEGGGGAGPAGSDADGPQSGAGDGDDGTGNGGVELDLTDPSGDDGDGGDGEDAFDSDDPGGDHGGPDP